MSLLRCIVVVFFVTLLSVPLQAACVNKYVFRKEGPKVVVTALTGKLTFQEAKDLGKAIQEKRAAAIEWTDAEGKMLSRANAMDVVRPMPVGCDGKSSGSVIELTFLRNAPPAGVLHLRLAPDTVVAFEEQKK